VTWKSLHETCAFDAENLRLLGQDKEDRWGTFALDLAPAFAAAQALGMRSIPSPVPPPPPGAVLYRVTDAGAQSWGYRVLGSQLEISVGPLAAPRTETSDLGSAEAALAEATRQEAARVADGYRHALELDGDALRSMACAWSQEIDVLAAEGGDDEEDEDEDADEDEEEEDGDGEEQEDKAPPVIAGRLGGLPNGLAVERWPRCRDEHMGFLLQLETGDLVPGYAAVALFCVTSGTATEDDEDEQDQNEAVFLTAAELASPETPAPEGVPVMPPRPIAIQAKLGEIDEARMAPLVERDLALGAALDALLGSGSGLQAGSTFSKRGGLPSWVQSAVREPTGYIMQLDFDRIRLDESWEEAGLAGCVMVFWNGEGNRPSMFWQYT
ncbi:MAG: hypothetical protein IT370_14025, partial [Deltaproteobacteria bacterium]|nr:hypothetical protein [Deltaproteobacteria bacterium]